jgi:glucosamine-6-phosphate deaminase
MFAWGQVRCSTFSRLLENVEHWTCPDRRALCMIGNVLSEFMVRQATIRICPDRQTMGLEAGEHAAALLREALAEQPRVRLIVACAPSQQDTLAALTAASGIEWPRVDVFHMDEYCGLPASHPAGFRRWLDEHLGRKVSPGHVEYLAGDADDTAAECRRYASLLAAGPIDVCLLGFGENGHIAFNDPPDASFDDPALVKVVTLDQASRVQQVAEGHFPTIDAVPTHALTLTCPALLGARHLVSSVPGPRKAEAVRQAIRGPRTPACPASAVMDHPSSWVYLDRDSAALL